MEYEQEGTDRTEYGEKLIERVSNQLQLKKLKGFSPVSLRMYRLFYLSYPQNQQSLTRKFKAQEVLLSDKNPDQVKDANLLIHRLSFTHIIELLKADNPLKLAFYQTEAIRNNWSVRDL